MTLRGSPGLSQRALTKDNSFNVFNIALSYTNTSCDKSCNKTLPLVRTAARSLEETREIYSTGKFSRSVNTIANQGRVLLTHQTVVSNHKQISNSGDERKLSYGLHSSTLLNYREINYSARFSFAKLIDCLIEILLLIS